MTTPLAPTSIQRPRSAQETMPSAPPTGTRFPWKKLATAFAVAAASDLVCSGLVFAPPLVWVIDLATAIALFAVLGWHWLLLPGLLLEAIPGLAIIPVWVLVVVAIAVWGTARPGLTRLARARRPLW